MKLSKKEEKYVKVGLGVLAAGFAAFHLAFMAKFNGYTYWSLKKKVEKAWAEKFNGFMVEYIADTWQNWMPPEIDVAQFETQLAAGNDPFVNTEWGTFEDFIAYAAGSNLSNPNERRGPSYFDKYGQAQRKWYRDLLISLGISTDCDCVWWFYERIQYNYDYAPTVDTSGALT